MSLDSLSHLSNQELLRALEQLVARSHAVLVDELLHIAEVDARRLYLEQACSSMFSYCVERLGRSESEAYLRIRAARAVRRRPSLSPLIAAGKLHLTAIGLIASHLDDDDAEELIASVVGLRKRAIEKLLADRNPSPDERESIRRTPSPHASNASHEPTPASPPEPVPAPPPSPTPRGPTRDRTKPLGEERYSVKFTASEGWKEKLDKARALASHSIPSGSMAELLEAGLDLLIEDLERKRFGRRKSAPRPTDKPTTKPSATPDEPPGPSRHIPAAVKRAVYERDGLRCTFVDAAGHRCTQTRFLEFDHLDLWCLNGEHEADRLRLALPRTQRPRRTNSAGRRLRQRQDPPAS